MVLDFTSKLLFKREIMEAISSIPNIIQVENNRTEQIFNDFFLMECVGV
jgi:hypothetical protein